MELVSVIEAEYRRQVARMVEIGAVDLDCVYCRDHILCYERPVDSMAPRHNAKRNCQSGKHPHCTCDTCF